MKLAAKLALGVLMAILFSAALCGPAEAHRRGFIGGPVIIAPPPPVPYFWWRPYGYYPPPPPYYPPPDYGWLKTDVEPNSAEVWVDGRWAGYVKDYDGPVNHLRLPLGRHEVEFRTPGYKGIVVDVTIVAGGTTKVEYDLEPLPARPPSRHGNDECDKDDEPDEYEED